MNRLQFPSGLLALLLAGASTSLTASAAVTAYTSSADFLAALSGVPTVTEDYESYPLDSTIAPGATLNGVVYLSFPGAEIGRIDDNYNRIGDQSLASTPALGFFPSDSFLEVGFTSPIYALGIFFNIGVSDPYTMGIITPVGVAGTGGAYDQSTLYFAGLISDTPFDIARIGTGPDVTSGFNLDNLTYAVASPVPDQTGLAGTIALAGLVLAGHFRKRLGLA